MNREEVVYKAGDNIYEPQGGNFKLVDNKNHTEKNQRHDLSGEFVLVSTKFYYFGRDSQEIEDHLRPRIPIGQSAHGVLTHNSERARAFINYVTENFEVGVHYSPHDWPSYDISWKCQ